MCKNLIKANYKLLVYDLDSSAVDELTAFGAIGAGCVSELAAKCEVIVTMLPDGPQVKDVLLNDDGVIQNGRPGSLIIEMSSIAPAVSIECEKAARAVGLRMIDAPVSGGEPKAIDGTLAIMCGGDKADYDEALPILNVLGSSSVLTGSIGSGNTTKLANQIIVGINIAAVGEALTLAVKAGVDPKIVFSAIRGGLAGSTVLDAKVPMILDGNFKPGFKIDLHIKDLKNAITTAKLCGSPVEITTKVLSMMELLASKGEGQNDHSGLICYFEDIAGCVVRKEG